MAPSHILDRLKGAAERILRIKSWCFYTLESKTRHRQQQGIQYFAMKTYRPAAYPGRVALIRPAIRPKDPYPDSRIGWEGYVTGKLEVHEVPGDHRTMFHDANVEILASEIKNTMDHVGNGEADSKLATAR